MIERIEAAETKDELLAIADEMNVPGVNKRMGVETIRAELMEAISEATLSKPEAAKPEPKATEPEPEAKPKQRMLKHRKSGRLLPWTAALAKKREMAEV